MLREGQSLVKYNSRLRWQQGRCKLEYLKQKTVILHEFKFSAGINFQVFAYYYCDDHIKSVLRVSQSTFVELLVTHAMGGLPPQSKLKQKNENKFKKKTRQRERKMHFVKQRLTNVILSYQNEWLITRIFSPRLAE